MDQDPITGADVQRCLVHPPAPCALALGACFPGPRRLLLAEIDRPHCGALPI